MNYLEIALYKLTEAREWWFENHNADFDADYYAQLFENAQADIEKLIEECEQEAGDTNG